MSGAASSKRSLAERVRRVFDEAADLPPAERGPFLDRACGGDAVVRRRVEALLAVDDDAGDLFDRPTQPNVAPAESQPLPQAIGPYRILGVLGRGGMGVVYRAQRDDGGPEAALKSVALPHPEMAAGIRREIGALSRLSHPGLVRILDEGEADGVPWYAMELVTGASLRERIATNAPAAELLTIVRRLCVVLAYVHGEGVVHRDLKPDNVRVRPDGAPVLLDFGLTAHFAGPASRESLAAVPDAMGTADYLAPEQALGLPLDARADLYSLGCMLYEILTGRPPLVGKTPLETVRKRRTLSPRPPSRGAHGLPAEMDALVLRLLQRDPRRRLGHAADVAAALVRMGADPRDPWEQAPPPRSYLYRASVRGRDDALKELRRIEDGLAAGNGALVLVGGESGVGKTRLLLEVAAGASSRSAEVVTGECLPAGQADPSRTPLLPFRRLLVEVSDRLREDAAARRASPFSTGARVLSRFDPALAEAAAAPDEAAPALGPVEERARVAAAVCDAVTALAGLRPLVFILDDIQWADELATDVLARLARVAQSRPLLVIGAYRAEDPGDGVARLARLPSVRTVRLHHLSATDVGAVVADMLARDDAPPPFVSFLAQASEGNPFFVAEYLRSALDEGWLSRDESGTWRLSAGVSHASLPLPRSLRELVSRRVGNLPAATRALVDAMAVVGRQSSAALLSRVCELSEGARGEAIAALVLRHVIEEPRAGLLRFTHDKLREVAYESIAEPARRALHLAAALALEGGADDAARTAAALAHHYTAAGDDARAVPYLLAAAREAAATFSMKEAERLFRAYLALAPAGAERVEARHALGYHVLTREGARRRAAAELEVALGEARSIGRKDLEAAVLNSLGRVQQYLGEGDAGIASCRAALALAEHLGDEALVASSKLSLATLWNEQHRGAEGLAWAHEALQACRAQGDDGGVVRALVILAVERHEAGDATAARALYHEALPLARGKHAPTATVLLSNLGNLSASEGDLDAAKDYFERAIAAGRDMGQLDMQAVALGSLAALNGTLGDLETERRLHERAVALLRDVEEKRSLAIALGNLAGVLLELGRLDQAHAAIDEGLEVALASGTLSAQGYLTVERGRLLAARGDIDGALALGDEASALLQRIGSHDGVAQASILLSTCERKRERPAAAREHATRAVEAAERAGERITLAHGLVEVARVARMCGDDPAPHVARATAIAAELRMPPGSRLARDLAELGLSGNPQDPPSKPPRAASPRP